MCPHSPSHLFTYPPPLFQRSVQLTEDTVGRIREDLGIKAPADLAVMLGIAYVFVGCLCVCVYVYVYVCVNFVCIVLRLKFRGHA